MQKNSEDFSMPEALRLANSPAGQKLLAMLRQADSEQLQKLMQEASAGDYDQAKQTASRLLSTPEAQQLLKDLGR